MLRLRLHEVILYVQDMDKQITFYREILGLQVSFPAEINAGDEQHWVTFATGGCTLALHSGGNKAFGDDAPRFVFAVEALAKSRQELADRNVPVSEIRSPAPGISVFDAVDPEGNQFSIESVNSDQ